MRIPKWITSLLLVITLSSSCSFIYAKPTPIDIPKAPTLASCPAQPDVRGVVAPDGQSIILPVKDALALRDWIRAYKICAEKNAIDQAAYIEKLINRLKALGGN